MEHLRGFEDKIYIME